MGFAFRLLATLAIGIGLGIAATWLTVISRGMLGDIADGPWRTSLATGSAESDPYQRASVAVHGLLALNRSETIYYMATTDSQGNLLAGNCIYRIAGRDPDTRWWSITAYGDDDYLIANRAHRYSVSKQSIVRRGDGTFVAIASRGQAGANWIPVSDGRFSLTLRLYNPVTAIRENPSGANLPSIARASCE
jgi:hypothetical protein